MASDGERRIYQGIALQLAEAINSGELRDGSLLPSERELAEKFVPVGPQSGKRSCLFSPPVSSQYAKGPARASPG